MGGRFLTEKQIEGYLVEEIRSLPMPDGTADSVRCTKLTWANYDIVLKYGLLSAIELSALTLFYADKKGLEFSCALREVLVPLRKQANRVLEGRIALRKRRMALRDQLRASFGGAVRGNVKPGEAEDPPKQSQPIVFKAIIGEQR